ncbi:helicase C-terminal domain-containing protein [Cohnella suwonensis]|uniref:Helicase C-terminal domain-containing protein n=1 Tax=Cohnella suwonensis TaxID=696072 RepID=A0ABW0LZF0_9BACL
MEKTLTVSVRTLVEYAYLSGSIDVGFRAASAMTEGTMAHRKIQEQYGDADRKEVILQAKMALGDLLLVVDGRCDGLLAGEDGIATIDEIKSTSRDVAEMTEEDAVPVHWAQALFYAYMYVIESGAERLRARLTYVQVETKEQKRFERDVTAAELAAFARGVAEAYVPYARMLLRNRSDRDESIAGLGFPFPSYREGQRKLVGAVYKAIDEGRKLFARAPTGIGKTASTLFPAIKAIGSGKLGQLFYLTARTLTRTAAEEALALMASQGLKLRSVTLTAKEKICFQDEVDCRRESCPYADGYYDRVNGAVLELLANEALVTRPVIEAYARKHRVCPFEFSLDVAYGADAVICDYNYVFDPRVAFKRMSGEQKNGSALLIDEAHNLVDRGRAMYSAALDKRAFLELGRAFKCVSKDVERTAKAINKWFVERRKAFAEQAMGAEGEMETRAERPDDLLALVDAFAASAERALAEGSTANLSIDADADVRALTDAYFSALAFQRIGKLYDGHYVTYSTFRRGEERTKMFCMNPSEALKKAGKGFRAHVFFSATLTPLNYYMDMLGADEADYSLTLGSPFAKEQWDVSVIPLSTRYADRDRTKGAVASSLLRMTEAHSGNYLAFFPSYEYMNAVFEAYSAGLDDIDGVRTMLQKPEMAEEERESFLASFDADGEGTLIGFAVMGGIFSEGIDLVGDRLNGVAVVGVGMPQLGPERNLIRSHFDSAGRNGFDYAYVYPGMNKVLQAGGRLIRSESDTGKLLLIDDRYRKLPYSRLLPEEWRSGDSGARS